MTHLHCMRCGEPAAVIDNETSLCGDCFLEAAVRRRRLVFLPGFHRAILWPPVLL
jgi:ribosomal protein S14